MIGLAGFVLLGAAGAVQAVPPAALVPPSPTAIDRAFRRMYAFDFPGSLAILDEAAREDPDNPLIPAVRASTYLFMEMDRLKILEMRFFLHDNNLVDGSAKLVPDPQVRTRFTAALDDTRRRATSRLAAHPDEVDALFAMCLAAGVETDYTALVERRTWRSMKLAPATLVYAKKLLARTPPFHDAYLSFGALEYIVGDLPFFIRWFARYDGIEGNKRRGIEQLKLTARYGRYLGPFARILLVVASLREKKLEDAQSLLNGLVLEFPENPLLRKELALVSDQVRRRPRK